MRFAFPCLQLFGGQEEAAAASDQFEYGEFGAASGGAGDRSGDGGQNSEDEQIVSAVQERGRFARDQGHRPEAPGKNAQVFDRWQARIVGQFSITYETFGTTEDITQ